jgi:hypothetical protein
MDLSAFQSLAEFGIARAGFTRVVVVFSRGDGQFQLGVYFFAVLCLLLIGSFAFVRMVFVRPPSN